MAMDLRCVEDLLNKLDGDFVASLRAQFDEYLSIQQSVDRSFRTVDDSRTTVNTQADKTQKTISRDLSDSKDSVEQIPAADRKYLDKGLELDEKNKQMEREALGKCL